MIGEIINCGRFDCDNKLVKTTHNMKYCSKECCRIQTNSKIMTDYHENKAIRNGKKRVCLTCSTSLSRYNPNRYCGTCEDRIKNQKQQRVVSVLASMISV